MSIVAGGGSGKRGLVSKCVVHVALEREVAFAQSFEVRMVTLTTLTVTPHTPRVPTPD